MLNCCVRKINNNIMANTCLCQRRIRGGVARVLCALFTDFFPHQISSWLVFRDSFALARFVFAPRLTTNAKCFEWDLCAFRTYEYKTTGRCAFVFDCWFNRENKLPKHTSLRIVRMYMCLYTLLCLICFECSLFSN